MGEAESMYQAWFEKVYPRLTGAGLWLRGTEINRLPPGEYERRPLRLLRRAL
jgi:hypothetical protein